MLNEMTCEAVVRFASAPPSGIGVIFEGPPPPANFTSCWRVGSSSGFPSGDEMARPDPLGGLWGWSDTRSVYRRLAGARSHAGTTGTDIVTCCSFSVSKQLNLGI